MRTHLLENYRYYLDDSIHFFVVRKDPQQGIKKVYYFKGNNLLADDQLRDRNVDALKQELQARKAPR